MRGVGQKSWVRRWAWRGLVQMAGPWKEVTLGHRERELAVARWNLGKPGKERRRGLDALDGPKLLNRRGFIVQLVAM